MRAALALLPCLVLFTGCHSAYVSATLHNGTTEPISLVELDYPSASFGTQTLDPGKDFTYRFKVLGSGKLKLLWTDPHRQDHHADGPSLGEGAEGTLRVQVTPAGVTWSAPQNPGAR